MQTTYSRTGRPNTVKLNARGCAALDVAIGVIAERGYRREQSRDYLARIFDLRSTAEIDRFWRVNIND